MNSLWHGEADFMQPDFAKVTNAAYKMIEFFPEDPLKKRSKEQALLVMESLVGDFKTLERDINVLEHYFRLANLQGWVSDMNVLILTKQYREFLETKVQVSEEKPVPVAKRAEGNFSERQNKIISILKQKEKAQVADLIKQLPRVTKRTIRRDLDDLLKKGKVARVGQWNQVFYQVQG